MSVTGFAPKLSTRARAVENTNRQKLLALSSLDEGFN